MLSEMQVRPPDNDTVSPEQLRQVMGYVPTSVAVVSAMTRRGPVGLTVGTFVSASLDPPLIGFLPARTSTTWPLIVPVGSFCVSVLGADNEQLSRQFATSGGKKFEGVPWYTSPHGSPVIEGCLASFDCAFERCYPAGDHWFVLGRVLDLDVRESGHPLVFCHGGYERLASAPAIPSGG
ncbi:flavin reductase family protein [Salinactinospora qingdaonensis]|uniref:Flavin reductase family protein n=1 Tax=Salinactinospora qingdaonensis TaxID=702744 RepID=A0ABP7F8Y8_9ACTN